MPAPLSELLRRTAARHSHLCPRQVLGVRMGLAGLLAAGVVFPVDKSTGFIIVETDGCFVDGIEVATGAAVGHRTLRVQDFGKLAATFVNIPTGRSIRLATRPDSRRRAYAYAPRAQDRYASQLDGYRVMPEDELFRFQPVTLSPSPETLLGKPEARVICGSCGEEVLNERQILYGGVNLCPSCAGQSYYAAEPKPDPLAVRLIESAESS